MKINEVTGCKYGEYYCSTDKKVKCRKSPKKSRTVSEKRQVIKQSHVFDVLNKLAARKDNNPFPVRFYDGGTMSVRPNTAKRIIDLYYRVDDKIQRKILKYIATYNGFKQVAKAAGAVQESAGVGKITKQNTTDDVKPGETQRQAAKFGNKVDKDGRPPELHAKARKNSDPNTLYNLGLVSEADEERKPVRYDFNRSMPSIMKYAYQPDVTRALRKAAGLSDDAPVYFDDADLVYGDETVIPRCSVDNECTFGDAVKALKNKKRNHRSK